MSVEFYLSDEKKPRECFRMKTGVYKVKSDNSIQEEVIEGHVDSFFLRDTGNLAAYTAYKKGLDPKKELPLVTEAPEETEVLEDEKEVTHKKGKK